MKKICLVIISFALFSSVNDKTTSAAAWHTKILAPKYSGNKYKKPQKSIKPKFEMFIDNCQYQQSNSDYLLYVTLLFFNNTSDTLKYIGTNCLYSSMYHVSNKNMIILNDACIQGYKIGYFSFAPHQRVYIQLSLKFHEMPDTSFKFRLGMSLIKWNDNTKKKKYINENEVKHAPILWSQSWNFKTDRKHQDYGLSEEENRQLILKEPLPVYYALTQLDRKKYILSIDQRQVTRRDTIITKERENSTLYKEKVPFIPIHLKLTNNSSDTLRYMSMSCSWLDYYQFNIKGLNIWDEGCSKNIPRILTVLPHRSVIFYMPVMYEKNRIVPNLHFKIGMSLQKYISRQQPDNAYTYLLRSETSNLIWSNEVSVK